MPDLDDTIPAASRPAVAPLEVDVEDTVIGPRGAAEQRPLDPADTDTVPIQVVTAPSPTHYRFRVGEHSEPIALDVPAYLGRRPSSPRIQSGEIPRLIAVPSPLQEVSATHLEIRQLGSSVVVTDMRSTNGSVVIVPGTAPRKLRQGESVVVSPGTLVDIGDGNIVEILPTQRSGNPVDDRPGAGRQP